jgi:hypothetical protein
MPAAEWEPLTSARQPRRVLLAEGFMALEVAERSRPAARGSGKAASDIAEVRAISVAGGSLMALSQGVRPRKTVKAAHTPLGSYWP